MVYGPINLHTIDALLMKLSDRMRCLSSTNETSYTIQYNRIEIWNEFNVLNQNDKQKHIKLILLAKIPIKDCINMFRFKNMNVCRNSNTEFG